MKRILFLLTLLSALCVYIPSMAECTVRNEGCTQVVDGEEMYVKFWTMNDCLNIMGGDASDRCIVSERPATARNGDVIDKIERIYNPNASGSGSGGTCPFNQANFCSTVRANLNPQHGSIASDGCNNNVLGMGRTTMAFTVLGGITLNENICKEALTWNSACNNTYFLTVDQETCYIFSN